MNGRFREPEEIFEQGRHSSCAVKGQRGQGYKQRQKARIQHLRKLRRRKAFVFAAASFATMLLILACTLSYGAIRTQANDSFKYYTSITLDAGETLWEVAGQYMDEQHYDDRENYIDEVCSINHLADADHVTAGQMLIVPYFSPEFVK